MGLLIDDAPPIGLLGPPIPIGASDDGGIIPVNGRFDLANGGIPGLPVPGIGLGNPPILA